MNSKKVTINKAPRHAATKWEMIGRTQEAVENVKPGKAAAPRADIDMHSTVRREKTYSCTGTCEAHLSLAQRTLEMGSCEHVTSDFS